MDISFMWQNIYVRSILAWFLFIPIPILNGIFREKYLKTFLNDLTAHQLSTVILCTTFLFYTAFILHSELEKNETKSMLIIGGIWVSMTILFELIFGHYIAGASWEKLLADYYILKGRIWPLFLITMFFSPLLIKKIR